MVNNFLMRPSEGPGFPVPLREWISWLADAGRALKGSQE
jgi:hypothetical protein